MQETESGLGGANRPGEPQLRRLHLITDVPADWRKSAPPHWIRSGVREPARYSGRILSFCCQRTPIFSMIYSDLCQ